ncbi:hypothetical protein E1287_16520 [Actinomadura sp. KC06]|uniref:hypothetical protein n=1 Tax=Actinomadura sp. KC06 TaxID=2530369 RepID=UPI0010537B3C|nr:hypothetical protein [Actinomadura sp. KC06]TDD34495.1 hypothetical protein E1287_16520 [Actinomadura sp. KC06]
MPQEAAGAKRQTAGARTESHRLQDVLAVAAVTIGLAALVLGWIPATHFPGAVAGVIGLPLALYSQMISATTNERWLNVIGMVASFMGAAFALSNGGFSI